MILLFYMYMITKLQENIISVLYKKVESCELTEFLSAHITLPMMVWCDSPLVFMMHLLCHGCLYLCNQLFNRHLQIRLVYVLICTYCGHNYQDLLYGRVPHIYSCQTNIAMLWKWVLKPSTL